MNHTQAQVQSAAIVRMFKTELTETKVALNTALETVSSLEHIADDANRRDLQALRELKAALEKFHIFFDNQDVSEEQRAKANG
jgi:hypothetical protein